MGCWLHCLMLSSCCVLGSCLPWLSHALCPGLCFGFAPRDATVVSWALVCFAHCGPARVSCTLLAFPHAIVETSNARDRKSNTQKEIAASLFGSPVQAEVRVRTEEVQTLNTKLEARVLVNVFCQLNRNNLPSVSASARRNWGKRRSSPRRRRGFFAGSTRRAWIIWGWNS